jgi:hypothetical protein
VDVVTLNVAEVCPAATVTFAGTVAPLLPESVTRSPPVAAGPVKVTMPDVPVPPVTVPAVKVTLATVGAFTVN